jgi:1,4-dihydroxy-2-naphthoate octaprenyltransferase
MDISQRNIMQTQDAGAKKYLLATRPMFLTASILPVLLGSAIGYQAAGQLDAMAALLALLAIAFVHAGVNVINDVCDDLNGTDRLNTQRITPFTGGSRVIQQGILTVDQMRRWGNALLLLGAMVGLVLVVYKGYPVLVFGIAGIFLGVAYSAPPLKLVSRGIGEFTVAIGFGVLPIVGAAWLQSGQLTWLALLLSVPVGIWVANILLINEVPDVNADRAAGKQTLVVRYGLKFTAGLYLLTNVAALVLLIWAASLQYLNSLALSLCALMLLPALYACSAIVNWATKSHMMETAIKLTLTIHAVNSLWLVSWYITS